MLFCMLLLLHMACFHYMLDYYYLLLHIMLLHCVLLLQVWHEEVVSVCSDGEEELQANAVPQLDSWLERRSLHLLHPAQIPGQGDTRLPIFLGRNLTWTNSTSIKKSIHISLSNVIILSVYFNIQYISIINFTYNSIVNIIYNDILDIL